MVPRLSRICVQLFAVGLVTAACELNVGPSPVPSSSHSFGTSVAVSGTTALVGAPFVNFLGGDDAVYVLTESGSTWTQRAKLIASDGRGKDGFGTSVALSGTTALIGATSLSTTGAVYVFTGSGGSWTERAKLTASDGETGDGFGGSVALSGHTALVGAVPLDSDGAVYVFTGSGSSWTQRAKLSLSHESSDCSEGGDGFGTSVVLSGNTGLIGAPGRCFEGAAYVFTGSGGAWTKRAELTASDRATGDGFGGSVALAGSTALIGVDRATSRIGAVYVFTGSGSTWTQRAELIASDRGRSHGFGSSVALSGTTALVGAAGGDPDDGAVYIFTQSAATWKQSAELIPSNRSGSGRFFGSSVALSGTTAVIGTPPLDVYIFAGSGGTWTNWAKLTASD